MEELVINGQTYEFKFGIGFLRDMNKMIAVPVKEVPGMKKDVGFNYYAAEMLGGDVEALVMVLNTANKGQNPRITPAALEAYVEDPDTDIDELFDKDKDHIHCHLVTNSVSYEDGRKLHNTRKDLKRMKQLTNQMCRERGLTVAEKGKHFDGSQIEKGEVIA